MGKFIKKIKRGLQVLEEAFCCSARTPRSRPIISRVGPEEQVSPSPNGKEQTTGTKTDKNADSQTVTIIRVNYTDDSNSVDNIRTGMNKRIPLIPPKRKSFIPLSVEREGKSTKLPIKGALKDNSQIHRPLQLPQDLSEEFTEFLHTNDLILDKCVELVFSYKVQRPKYYEEMNTFLAWTSIPAQLVYESYCQVKNTTNEGKIISFADLNTTNEEKMISITDLNIKTLTSTEITTRPKGHAIFSSSTFFKANLFITAIKDQGPITSIDFGNSKLVKYCLHRNYSPSSPFTIWRLLNPDLMSLRMFLHQAFPQMSRLMNAVDNDFLNSTGWKFSCNNIDLLKKILCCEKFLVQKDALLSHQ